MPPVKYANLYKFALLASFLLHGLLLTVKIRQKAIAANRRGRSRRSLWGKKRRNRHKSRSAKPQADTADNPGNKAAGAAAGGDRQ